jgi:L-fuculose-phosphate aldolase
MQPEINEGFTMPRSLIHPRTEITDTLERIYSYKMTTTSGGNISIRDENGDIWITPARVDKGTLRAADIVCIHPDGSIDGLHKPSSEHPFHQAIYRARPDLHAIVHAHPVALVSFSICREVPDSHLFPQAAHVCGKIGYAPYALPGSAQLGDNIAATFAQGSNCVILENHGVAVGGADLAEAFQRFETLEFTAKTIIKAGVLRGDGSAIRYLTDAQITLAETARAELPSFAPPPASTQEKSLRQQLCDFIRRGYRQRLFTSTEGSFSARLSADSFLITCYRVDRKTISLDQLALIRNGRAEEETRPSRAARLHEAIYRKHPGVHAIVNAMPVNATAFSVTAAPLDARTIPESYIFLRDIGVIPFADQFSDGAAIADAVSLKKPAMFMENNGVLVLGTSVLDAFDRLEVFESTAEALINARPIGAVKPMEQDHISTLMKAFGLE